MDEHNVYLRPPIWLPIVVALILGIFFLIGKTMEQEYKEPPATINVTGEGKVSAAPDIARLQFGVTTGPQTSAKVAMEKLKTTMDSVIAAVKASGIEEKDIGTQGLYLNPMYDWTEGRQILRGYEATQSLNVKVRDTEKVGTVLSAATNAGANQAGGVSFMIDDPEELRAQARAKAIAEASEKAKKLATDLGVELGKLKGFTEGVGGALPPIPYMERAMGMGGGGDASVQVPTGEQEVTVTVTLTYEIDE